MTLVYASHCIKGRWMATIHQTLSDCIKPNKIRRAILCGSNCSNHLQWVTTTDNYAFHLAGILSITAQEDSRTSIFTSLHIWYVARITMMSLGAVIQQHMVHNCNIALQWSPLFQKQTLFPLELPNTVMVICTILIPQQHPNPSCLLTTTTQLGPISYISRLSASRNLIRTHFMET